ncbi:uncharacterized protein AKAW2_70369A [Aspergillus luchuensis]|uniref:Similar to An16g04280 n=1 Tax=Aspergillus kawachii TaxID=1069201 RepID=A0A146FEZ8_ASPKA|nr:uncharacterized protein AKAW2_70369A [Aspergillus luchuensis]BCS03491.1 hypothetical protein AKAW2_70369A [Aspergillus luchuensis]BCS15118.1 hypothetical protein ALUC_70351A [Aspergillus luchuensis]GAA85013.1 similar to An16g04280 [Aspergillus luchuensis IFO 4308]GAT24368.1 similar to An16g04280 [Aspergillus luchuensis]
MHTAALFLALSLSAHAVPVLNARGNDTVERREEGPYKVVNVAGPTTPVVETITATNPPAPPTTITVTEFPSSTPASVPGASPSPWNAGPNVGGAPLGRRDTNSSASALSRRAMFEEDAPTNSTASRRGLLDDATNSTLSRRAMFEEDAPTNSTASRRGILDDASNSTLSRRAMFEDTPTNSTLSRRAMFEEDAPTNSTEKHAMAARSNTTSEVLARSLNETAVQTRELKDALVSEHHNASDVSGKFGVVARDTQKSENATDIGSKVPIRARNDTVLQARAFNDTPSDTAIMSSRPHARGLNHTDSQA